MTDEAARSENDDGSADSSVPAEQERRLALLGEHRRSITARLRRAVPDEADRADLLQEVSLIVLRSPIAFTDERHFSSWCMGVIDNTVSRWQRSHVRRRRREVEAGEACWGGIPRVDDPELRTANLELVQRALAAVDDRSSRLLVARYVDCWTAEELALAASENAATIRMRLHRVRDVARRAISPNGRTEVRRRRGPRSVRST